jgi:XTP/dITP diphosphohydrolase
MLEATRERLVLASTNAGKLRELRDFLDHMPIQVLSPKDLELELPSVEEDGSTFAENATKKAISGSLATDPAFLVLADDSGLQVDALGGAPGVHSARFSGSSSPPAERDEENNRHLLHRLRDVPGEQRTARFVCVLALARGGKLLALAPGQVEGLILSHPAGSGGFGYDPVFCHPPSGLSLAQMSPEEKLRISHRGQALKVLRGILSETT